MKPWLWDPQELDLLGSQPIGNSSKNWTQTCFGFGGPAFTGAQFDNLHKWSGWTNVISMSHWYTFKDTNSYCGGNTNSKLPQGFGCLGMEAIKSQMGLWNNDAPKALPPNVFLICGGTVLGREFSQMCLEVPVTWGS